MNKKIFPFVMLLISVFIICYTLLKMYNEHFSFQHYFTIFIGMTFLFIGIYSYLQKPNSIVVQHFLALMFISGLAIALSTPSSWNIKPAKELEVIAVSFAPYILVKFFEHFPSSTKPAFFRQVRIITLFIAIFVTLNYFLIGIRHDVIVSTIVRPCIVANMVLSLLSCIVIFYLHLQSNSDRIRNQMYLLIAGLILSFAPVVIFSLIPDVFFSFSGVPFHYSLSSIIVFPMTLSYLLTKQEVVDFREIFRKISFQLLAVILSLVAFNLLLAMFYKFNLKSAVLMNTLLVCTFAVYDLIHKGLEPLKMKKRHLKNQEIQKEKLLILQQLLNGKHLEYCAKLIADLIHKTIDVSGVCLIWKNDNIPMVLHKTGVFLHFNDAELLTCVHQSCHPEKMNINGKNFFFYPMNMEDVTIGWVIIGEKTNATVFEKEEIKLIEKIRTDATELFSSSKSLQQIEKQLKETMKESQDYKQFHLLLINEQEEEKKKLSVFLHDEVLQNLILLFNKLELLSKNKEMDNGVFEDIKESLRNSIFEIREMCHELYPVIVEDLGLEKSLYSLKRKCQTNHNVIIEIDYNTNLRVIPASLSIQVFRMIKELVCNAIKHSSSKKVFVSVVETNNFLNIKVKDHGIGFKVPNRLSELSQNNHLGLITIQKRVNQLKGTLDIQSEPGAGTCVSITLPIDGDGTNENQSITSG
ncbi:sensor histidine kinase [Parageobacillus toebii]|uniref:sensor histidine kinase n=1 Tax=Parageobacillus toebii TaxID=153151 RepID=UPI001967E820|nr:ATP-binding protein [Parageobacillus toebii]QSB49030.1 histidine kinase [Parageobacillus toebii]